MKKEKCAFHVRLFEGIKWKFSFLEETWWLRSGKSFESLEEGQRTGRPSFSELSNKVGLRNLIFWLLHYEDSGLGLIFNKSCLSEPREVSKLRSTESVEEGRGKSKWYTIAAKSERDWREAVRGMPMKKNRCASNRRGVVRTGGRWTRTKAQEAPSEGQRWGDTEEWIRTRDIPVKLI